MRGLSESGNPKITTTAFHLTGGLVSVGADSDVVLLVALLGPRYLFHLSNLRHAEFRVVVEEDPTVLDRQVVLGPIPQFSEVLVVQCVESICTKKDR